MAKAEVLLIIKQQEASEILTKALQGSEFITRAIPPEAAEAELRRVEQGKKADIILVDAESLEFPAVHKLARLCPHIPIVLVTSELEPKILLEGMRIGGVEIVHTPSRREEIIRALQRALKRREEIIQWVRREINEQTRVLRREVDELRALLTVGHTLTSNLDLEAALKAVVDTARELTNAEESVLMLLDEEAGELYLRAESNLQSGIKTLRLKVQDSLAGAVVRSGKPQVIDQNSLAKIKTSYLVQALIYVPLYVQGKVIGVLGVDNRTRRGYFTDRDVKRLQALADYAAVALVNASLYSEVEEERRKLETIIEHAREGMAVIDFNGEVMLINRTAREAMGIDEETNLHGAHYTKLCNDPDITSAIKRTISTGTEYHTEIQAQDGRTFDVQIMHLDGIGVVLTFYDITHFKKLDQLKTSFVSAVSHDLRSPLTAALGYIELLERVGPLNSAQQEFIQRARASLDNITDIINNLLELGKIESGLDSHNELVDLKRLIRYSIEGNQILAENKHQSLTAWVEEDLPPVLGNAIRLRQVLDNLITNAIKYTPEGGTIKVTAKSRDGQVIITVEDNGVGIPKSEQRYIFNKFYRASNVAGTHPGTGLGLSIVKSIIENHKGRIWVDSEEGKGTKFTIVLPAAQQETASEEQGNPATSAN